MERNTKPRTERDHINVSDPNQATSQPMAGGGIGGTDDQLRNSG